MYRDMGCVDVCRPAAWRPRTTFLRIGGGYETSANQLSLERNVIFQQSVLASQRPDHPAYDVWFADGKDPHRDLQYRDPKFEKDCPPARRMLAELLGHAETADLVYRNNQVPNLEALRT